MQCNLYIMQIGYGELCTIQHVGDTNAFKQNFCTGRNQRLKFYIRFETRMYAHAAITLLSFSIVI